MISQTETVGAMPMLDQAKKLATRGKPVFPCKEAGKEPLTHRGFKDASCDPSIVHQWWTEHPNANIGIRTGVESGLVVLDVDMDPSKNCNGEGALAALEKTNEPLPLTCTVKTPRGGRHLYFQHPGGTVPCSAGKLGPGLDVRGDGGYVVAPPSVTAHGAYSYTTKMKTAPLPPWLRELMVTRTEPIDVQKAIHAPTEPTLVPDEEARIREALRHIPASLAYDDWVMIGMALHRWDHVKGLSIFDEWSQTCPEKYDASVVAKSWKSFNSDRVNAVSLASLFDLAKRHGWKPPVSPRSVTSVPSRGITLVAPVRWSPMPEVLPNPFSSLVSAGSEAIGCDPAAIALPLLAAAASVIGNTRRIVLKESWTEPSVLWLGLVMPSGERKSPAMELAMIPLQEIQDREFQRYQAALAEHKRALRRSREDDAEAPSEPVAVRQIVKDTSLAALAVLLEQNPRGLLLARDELSAWLGSFDRFDQQEEAAHWLEMHRAGPVTVDRKTGDRKVLHVPHAAVSITGTIQPSTLKRMLQPKLFDNGLAARLWLTMPPRVTREWNERVVPASIAEAVRAVFDRLLLFGFNPAGQPVSLPLTPGAKARFIEFYRTHGAEMDSLSGPMRAAYAKLEGGAARLALVLHCVRLAARGETAGVVEAVGEDDMKSGIALAEWFKQETQRIHGTLVESDDQRDARSVIDLAKAKGQPLSVRDTMREGPCFEKADRAEAVVALLVEADYLRRITERGKQGQNKERFELTGKSDQTTDSHAVSHTDHHDPSAAAEVGLSVSQPVEPLAPPEAGLSVRQAVEQAAEWKVEP